MEGGPRDPDTDFGFRVVFVRRRTGRAGFLPSYPRWPRHRVGKPAGNRRKRSRLTYPLARVRGDVTADGGPIGLPPSSLPAGTPPPGGIRAAERGGRRLTPG